jgi:5-methylthioadenosine/S-adenosylhomocysteine deaminase
MTERLLINGTVLTMDAQRRIIHDGAVLVRGSRIAEVGSAAELGPRHAAAERIDAAGGLIMPGFVNTHTHLFQTLLKGLGDDRPLYRWLKEMTTPAASQLTEEHCEAAALHGAIEAIRSGATTTVDFMYAHPRPQLADAVIRGLSAAGVRAVVARGFLTQGVAQGLPASLIETAEAALADVERLRALHADREDRIRIGIAPCLLWMVDEAALRAAREYATANGMVITYHYAETSFEADYAQRTFGTTETAYLERIGFLGPELLAVHCTKLDGDGVARFAAHDVKVSHNPISNMYLASGVAPIVELLRAGVTVGVATDGPASNNNQNMVHVLKYAALLHKVAHEDALAMTADKVLEMATIDAARSIGMDAEIGSVEVGKRADLITVAFDNAFVTPVHDPVSSLVYAALGNEVRNVLVDGQPLLRDGQLTTLDEQRVMERSGAAALDLATRAGLPSKSDRRWRPYPPT